MKSILHLADKRGHVNIGWLNSHHSFSFGHYHDPSKMQFGKLRVLNDDIITGGSGFGEHPHDNMEIVSIPLSGALEHKDSTGTAKIISSGDVQIMSAGSGISHAEYNHYKERETNFLQIWILPQKRNIEPRYEQKTFHTGGRLNKLQTIVAPDDTNAVWINQSAWLSRVDLDAGKDITYEVRKNENGVYVFVLHGSIVIQSQQLFEKDAMGIWDTGSVTMQADTSSEILLIEVPM